MEHSKKEKKIIPDHFQIHMSSVAQERSSQNMSLRQSNFGNVLHILTEEKTTNSCLQERTVMSTLKELLQRKFQRGKSLQ